MNTVFATQSMLQAIGVGARRSLPAAATINWVLKDGLGRLGRLSISTKFGGSFDADLKRFRFVTSIMYCVALAMEYSTPLAPRLFLPLASLANIGKNVGLATYVATQPAFHRSFARGNNLADISAKSQARRLGQQMVFDNVGLALAVLLTHLVRGSERAQRVLPLALFPVLAAGDLASIYFEMKAIHLRSLNRERAEILADHWLGAGASLTPAQVSRAERLLLPPRLDGSALRLSIGALEAGVEGAEDVRALVRHRPPYFLKVAPRAGGRAHAHLALSAEAEARDVLAAVLQTAILRRELRAAPQAPPDFVGDLEGAGWQTDHVLLSRSERARYSVQGGA
ncbi:hypothetical protein QBZ16_000385 [Prototheca wickerhamii]|uniref:Protein root UVB sensitive/RUS domain-containing protein n=1 Tax=Prototheca wickerhamii TaxID=3111 RepID=A0AAD9IPV5_PROWI|nr:hypothetical protein QBZ16_000385 [Prototheca wickerhamii]